MSEPYTSRWIIQTDRSPSSGLRRVARVAEGGWILELLGTNIPSYSLRVVPQSNFLKIHGVRGVVCVYGVCVCVFHPVPKGPTRYRISLKKGRVTL